MKLFIGNKNYSSWSLRGWLAAKQSGLSFEEILVPIFGEGWDDEKRNNAWLAPSHGKVPVLWDGDVVVWDSSAILDYLADKVGQERFWPESGVARAMARSMVAEMHSSYMALRRQCPMNLRRQSSGMVIDADVGADTQRILRLWAEARSRFGSGGPYLFGTFCAADIAFAPVVTRFVSYGFTMPGFAATYIEALTEQTWMQEWREAAKAEPWVIARLEDGPAG